MIAMNSTFVAVFLYIQKTGNNNATANAPARLEYSEAVTKHTNQDITGIGSSDTSFPMSYRVLTRSPVTGIRYLEEFLKPGFS